MAVLGRAVGLPTRYVEGFLMPSRPQEGNIYEVKKLNSHAWVEIYFPKLGWLTFDPTPIGQNQHIADEQQNTGAYDNYYWEEYLHYQQHFPDEAGYIPDYHDTSEAQSALSPWNGILQALIVLLVILLSLAAGTLGGLKIWDYSAGAE